MTQSQCPSRFAIMCQPRTGSYLLVDLLNQFADITCHGEVFKPTTVEVLKSLRDRISLEPEEREKYPITAIRRVFDLTPNDITGFKIFASHNAMARQFLLESIDIQKIVLTRNPLETYFSQQRAQRTGEWLKKKLSNVKLKPDAPKLRFNAEKFARHAKRAAKLEADYAAAEAFTKQKFYWIRYEELARIEPVRRIAEFLGGRDLSAVLAPTIEKQITEPLANIVENFDEMRAHLNRNGFEEHGGHFRQL